MDVNAEGCVIFVSFFLIRMSVHEIDLDDASYDEIIEFLHTRTTPYQDHSIASLMPLNLVSSDVDAVNLGQSFFKDLEMFVDFNGSVEQSIFEHVVGCQTTFGRHLVRYIWSNPTSNVVTLRRRQHLVELLQHLNIQALLRKVHVEEPNLFLLWDPEKKEALDILKDTVFFNYPTPSWFPIPVNDMLNRMGPLLMGTCLYREYLNPAHILLSPILPIIFPFLMLRVFKMPMDSNAYINILKSQFISDGGIFKYIFGKGSMITMVGALGLSGLWIFLYCYNIYTAWRYSRTVATTVQKFRQHWKSYYSLYQSANEIYHMIPDQSDAWPLLESEFNMSRSRIRDALDACAEVFPMILFQSSEKLLERGRLLQTYHMLHHLIGQNVFQTLFYWIGIMDYHRWINYLVGSGRFQYARFKAGTVPYLRIRGCIHPYLTKAVANDVDMSKNPAMMISGPNAGGKSTYMKAVAIHVLFAQTMGFAPGEVTVNPYESMDTYLHIPDCKGRESLFQAEMNRCIDFMDKVAKGRRSFMMMDEIFTSTNVREGIEAAHHVLRRLIDQPNLTLMVTTHFEDLRRLEGETEGKIRNYYVEIRRGVDRKICFTYKIRRGVTEERIALELMKQRTNCF